MDKYLVCIIHNELFICGRMAGWGTRDPKRSLKLPCLVSSLMILIRQAGLGRCVIQVRRWASAGAGPTRAPGLLSSESRPKGHDTHTNSFQIKYACEVRPLSHQTLLHKILHEIQWKACQDPFLEQTCKYYQR